MPSVTETNKKILVDEVIADDSTEKSVFLPSSSAAASGKRPANGSPLLAAGPATGKSEREAKNGTETLAMASKLEKIALDARAHEERADKYAKASATRWKPKYNLAGTGLFRFSLEIIC